jgi:hypothetical protein
VSARERWREAWRLLRLLRDDDARCTFEVIVEEGLTEHVYRLSTQSADRLAERRPGFARARAIGYRFDRQAGRLSWRVGIGTPGPCGKLRALERPFPAWACLTPASPPSPSAPTSAKPRG